MYLIVLLLFLFLLVGCSNSVNPYPDPDPDPMPPTPVPDNKRARWIGDALNDLRTDLSPLVQSHVKYDTGHCVAILRKYETLLGIKTPVVAYARDWYSALKSGNKGFTKYYDVVSDDDARPGDVVATYGITYGHVFVLTDRISSNPVKFRTIEQSGIKKKDGSWGTSGVESKIVKLKDLTSHVVARPRKEAY